ncbi:MAG: MFS transporter [Pseudomonadota bacterium]
MTQPLTTDPASPPQARLSPTASWGEFLSGRNAWRAVAVTGGVALHAINVHIVTTVLPSVVQDIGGVAWYAWNTTLFVVASILGATLSARLLQGLGPRRGYLAALGLFVLGSMGCALAPTMAWMLAGRTVQGLGGGVLAAFSYALIRYVFDARLWPRAVALVSGMWGVATLCGPAVGGVFAQLGHWRWAFWALLPVALVQALIVSVQLPARTDAPGRTTAPQTALPLRQIVLLISSALCIAMASLFSTPLAQVAVVVVGLALGLAVARVDSHARARLLPTGAYALFTPLGAIYASVALLLIGTDTEIFVPYFLQHLHGFSPLAAGYLTAAMAGGWSAASLLSSGLHGASAARMLRLGPVVGSLSLMALALLMPVARLEPVLQTICMGLALAGVGFGVGAGWPHLLTRVLSLARPGEENLASTSITTVQLYGMAVGAAIAGLVANAAGLTQPGGNAGAQSAAVWLFASFALAPALAALLAHRIVGKRG